MYKRDGERDIRVASMIYETANSKATCGSRLRFAAPHFKLTHSVVTWCLRTYIGLRPYMVNVYIKERINDQTTICAGGVTGNTTYLGHAHDPPLTCFAFCFAFFTTGFRGK